MVNKYKVIILALILINLFNWVSHFEFDYGIPSLVKYILSLSSLVILIYYLVTNSGKPKSGILFVPAMAFFVLWSIYLLVSALMGLESLFGIQRLFGQPYFYLPYLIPLILLFTRFDIDFFSWLFYVSYILLIPALITQVFILFFSISLETWDDQLTNIQLFSLGTSFLLLTSHYSNRMRIPYMVTIYFLIMIIMFTFYGRRGILVEYGLFILFMILIRLGSFSVGFAGRLRIYVYILIMMLAIPIFAGFYRSSHTYERGGINREAFLKSRGRVIEDYIDDFNNNGGWFLGRGLDGRVFRRINNEVRTGDTIENGFLILILKGGILYMALFVTILLRASWLGFFRSNNDLVKSLGVLLFIYVLMMTWFNLPVYSSAFILIWIFASACFSPELRNLDNDEVRYAINSRFA